MLSIMDEVRSNNNVVYRCTYHVVWCPKYRRKVITGDVDIRLKQIIREVCAERGSAIVELETMPDHVHLLVECDPQYGIHRLIKQIKGRSSRLIRQEFPQVKSRIPTLWTNSYFVATVGGATLEIVKRYVENQRNA
jgi:putative transposase